jgi:uncharacterized protein
MERLIYLHGFASSPDSRKARSFQTALAAAGIELEIPAMDAGDFENLTISRQMDVMNTTLRGAPARLIGSSMGGYVAALYAAAHPEVSRLVLLAPAFGFAPRWKARLGEPAPRDFEVFHYGSGTMRRVRYDLIEDALNYPATPDFDQPALIFHGVHDDVVPIENSRAFAARHSNTRLIGLDSDHELLNVLDQITTESTPFLTA